VDPFSWAAFTYIVSFSEEVKRAAYAGKGRLARSDLPFLMTMISAPAAIFIAGE
jgi:hypothetical protein